MRRAGRKEPGQRKPGLQEPGSRNCDPEKPGKRQRRPSIGGGHFQLLHGQRLRPLLRPGTFKGCETARHRACETYGVMRACRINQNSSASKPSLSMRFGREREGVRRMEG